MAEITTRLFSPVHAGQDSKPIRWAILVLGGLFLLQWLLLFTSQTPVWDAAFYYAYARSPVFDQDLHFGNDLQLAYPTASADFADKAFHHRLTSNGRVRNEFAPGSAALWLPWLAIVRLGARLLAPGGPVTGYEWPFVQGAATLSVLAALAAFWLSYRLCRQEMGYGVALAATATLMFTTPLLFYQFRHPLYSHAAAAFITTLCVYTWWRQEWWRPGNMPSRIQAFGLGALIGLASLVRWQHLIYLGLPAISILWAWLAARSRHLWRQWASRLLLLATAAFLLVSLQMSIWYVLYGHWLTIPQGATFLDWRAPFLIPALSSSHRGLFPWMPVASFALLGLLLFAREKPRLALPLFLVFLLEVYVNSITRDWFAGGAFGPRRFTSELAILAVGYAGLLQTLPGRYWRRLVAAGLGLALALHQWILLRYALVEQLGGRNLSMAPDYRWQADGLVVFARQIGRHLFDLFRDPIDFLIFPGSPLDMLLRLHAWPLPAILSLLGVSLFLALLWGGSRWLQRKAPAAAGRYWPLLLVFFVVATHIWLLFGA